MITQDRLADQIIAYLNGELTLQVLVGWAEDAIVTFTESDERPENSDQVWDTLLYLGAADTSGFPLTWETLKGMLENLGRPIQRVMA